ncbi:MAG: T9SS type A sorting domain-containing protein [Flavobacteriales bacterium]
MRFQNTGNAPAQDVRIQDTIDVNYDLETFRLVANSHSVMTTINEQTRVVDFFFENIQLPDSVNNEPESHGLVSYAITPYADLVVDTELNNTAYIYFDNNEPIITNTTWTTIHECGGEAAFEASAAAVCIDETVEFTSTYPQLDDYTWSVNDETEGSENSFSRIFTEAGSYEIEFIGENPLCTESSVQTITVYPVPTVTISQNGDLLASSEGDAYQWFLNGEALEGATNQEYSVTEDGTYTVEVTNGALCTGTSEGVMVVNISELEAETILLYPNPMADRAFLEFEDASVRTIRLMDSTGKEVRVWNSIATPRIEISREELAAGNYVVSVNNGSSSRNIQLIIR